MQPSRSISRTTSLPPTPRTATPLECASRRAASGWRPLTGSSTATIGLIHSGSVIRRYTTRCGGPGCRCHGSPPQPHGSYYQWTAKVNAKTVTRRLSPKEAELYKEWIANDRQLRQIIKQMRQVAAAAARLRLEQVASQ